MNADFSVLDKIVMPKSNAYDSKNVTLRMLVQNHDNSRVKKFAKKVIEINSPHEHEIIAKELWEYHLTPKCPNKLDAHDLSIVHSILAGN